MRFLAILLRVIKKIFFPSKPRSLDRMASFGKLFPFVRWWNKGFSVTGNKQIPRKQSYQNLLVVGATGTGKSSTCLIPTILTLKNTSLVIHDPSGELFEATAGRLTERGYNVQVFNPANVSLSDTFNVLAYCQTETALHKLARTLIQTSGATSQGEPIWEELATALLSIILRGLHTKPKEYHTLPNVYHLLHTVAANPEGCLGFFRETGNEQLQREYDAFIHYEEKLRTGIIATATGALHYLADSSISRITATDTLFLYAIRAQKTAIFIQNKIGEGAYYRPLSSLFFEILFSVLFSHRPERDELDVFLLLDEASSLVCPTLPLAIANLRKYRVGMLIALQEFAQLASLYGINGAETIRTNCLTRLYYGGGSLSQCQELEATLGIVTYLDEQGNKRERPLLSADEIRMLPATQALLLSGSLKPFLLSLRPYYQQFFLKRHARKRLYREPRSHAEPRYYPN